MTATALVLERVIRVAPFGLGLWDTGSGRLESDGLAVRVFRLAADKPLDWVRAIPNRRGLFVAHDLPGLGEFEARAGSSDFWPVLSPAQPYLVEVLDPAGRFIPFVLRVGLPAPPGLVVPACIIDLALPEPVASSPPLRPAYVPLFSTPSRLVPAGKAAVRATLIDTATGAPAEYAVLEVSESGRLLGRGVTDDQGQVVAVFPYPEPPPSPPPSSPPFSPPSPPASPQPLTSQRWVLEIAVRYRRNLTRFRPDPASRPLAELCEVVQQPPAAAVVTADSPSTPLADVELRYGEELVLAAGSGGKLFITPA